MGLKASIEESGLPVKATLLWLRDNERERFRAAKAEQVAVRRRMAEREAKALEILTAPDAPEPSDSAPEVVRGR